MKLSALLATSAAAVAGMATLAGAGTLDDVKARGELICGVNQGVVGFSAPDANGNWSGIDVSYCRALAAAVLGDGNNVKFVGLSGQNRFTAVASGEVDVLARNSTWTFQRENDLKLVFIGVNYYDGQGFMVPKELGIASALELGAAPGSGEGASVCIQTGTTTELNLADYFKANNLEIRAVNVDSNSEGEQQLLAGACDAYTTDISGLASMRASFANPDDYIILPDVISKEPLGPSVRQGDDQWESIARWTLFALIAAEEYGVTKDNAADMAATSTNPEVQRLLGVTDDLGTMFGLDADWAKRAISAEGTGGNYGEIFDATIGAGTPIKLERGLNDLWTKGGLMYSPPFR